MEEDLEKVETAVIDPAPVEGGVVQGSIKDSPTWVGEMTFLTTLILPSCITNAFMFLMPVVDNAFIGHFLGTSALAASSMANTLFNLIWLFVVGVATGMDHYTSQAHGAENPALVTLWTRRAIVVLLACSGPTILFLLSVKPLLVNVLGRTVEQATQTATFCSVIAISVPILCVFHVQIKFLQVRNQMKVPLVVMAVGNVTNVVFNYILISAYGLVGAAFSTVFSRLVQLLLAWAFIAYDQRSLPRKDRLMAGFLVPAELAAAVEWAGIKQYLKTGIAGGFMIGLETWGFDIAVLMASRLGDVSLNAHVILLSASAFTFVTFPLAVATAATIRAGNMLGAGKPRTARMASILCLSASVAAMSIMGVFLLAFRTVLGRAVSVDPEVIEKVASATHIIALFQIADGFQGTAAGVLRGVGKHHIVAVVNFIGFWGLGLPMCYFLAFSRGMGLQGLWWGHFAGISAVAAVHAFVFTTVDWDKEARIAVEQSSVPIEAEFNELELEEM